MYIQPSVCSYMTCVFTRFTLGMHHFSQHAWCLNCTNSGDHRTKHFLKGALFLAGKRLKTSENEAI